MPNYLIINQLDDVAVCLEDFKKGQKVAGVTLLEDIKQGHKVLLHDAPKGSLIHKYGFPIGKLTKDCLAGSWIHSHNLGTTLGEGEPTYHYEKKVYPLEEASSLTWNGYLRNDGRAGTRNDIFIIPTVGCINGTVALMKEAFIKKRPEFAHRVKVCSHPYGCSQLGDDLTVTQRVLAGLANNPNAGALLVVGLGCENNRLSNFLSLLPPSKKERTISFNAQEVADEVGFGEESLERLALMLENDKRIPLPLEKLSLGLKCGGSDGLSGLSANPLLGHVSEIIATSGGQVVLTEVPEMFGAETILMSRSKDEETFEKVVHLINNFKAYYASHHQVCYENPSPGNKDGGITTLEEKSLGCILKAGHCPVNDVLNIGEPLRGTGLSLVNGPGNDIVASTNLVASGINLLCFTTGRGTPFGSLVPTIKIATNHRVASSKQDWIDFDGERVFDEGFKATTAELLKLIIAVASGEPCKAERSSEGLMAIFKDGVTL